MKMRLAMPPGVVGLNANDDAPQSGNFGQSRLPKYWPESGQVKDHLTAPDALTGAVHMAQ
jgi:hypothetical protein